MKRRCLWALTPLMSAGKALGFMDTEQLTALRTGPAFLFIACEMSYTEFLYVHEIFNHAHAVFGSIALIQVPQPVAGKPVTAETVPGFTLPDLLTVFDSACGAGFWFGAVVAPAAGACLLISYIRGTETTVHATRSNQRRPDSIALCWSGCRHVHIYAATYIVRPKRRCSGVRRCQGKKQKKKTAIPSSLSMPLLAFSYYFDCVSEDVKQEYRRAFPLH